MIPQQFRTNMITVVIYIQFQGTPLAPFESLCIILTTLILKLVYIILLVLLLEISLFSYLGRFINNIYTFLVTFEMLD